MLLSRIVFVYFEQPLNALANDAERNAQRFYQSCIDVKKTRKALGKKSLLEFMGKIGSRPTVATLDGWDFQKAIQTAHNVMNLDAFFHWNAVPDSSSHYVIKVNLNLMFVLLPVYS